MPNFQLVTVADALQRTNRALPNPVLQEYLGYLDRVGPGQAGKLVPSDGETPRTLRLRLTKAAKAAGKTLRVIRSGDEVYFWNDGKRRPGRRRKAKA